MIKCIRVYTCFTLMHNTKHFDFQLINKKYRM